MATYEQQIKVSAVISPAERALQKLSDQLDRLQKAAQKILRPAPLRLDTRNAERQIAGLQRQIAGISSVQTVRVRVIREVEDRYLGGSGSTSGGGGMGMALAGAAAGAGLASRRQRALPPAGASTASVAGLLSAETTRTLRGVQNYVESTGKTVEALAKSGDAVITGGRRLVQVELQMRQLELQLSKAGTARNIPTRVRDITPQQITSYQPNAYRFPAQRPSDNAFYDRWRYRQTDRGPGSFFMGTQPVRTNGLGRQLSEFHIARESGKGSLTELQAELQKFFLTAEKGVITFSGLTPRLNKIYQRQLEAMKLPYQADAATGFRMQLPLRSQLTTARSAGPFVPPMTGPMAPRTLLERYQAGSIGFLGSRGGGGGRPPAGPLAPTALQPPGGNNPLKPLTTSAAAAAAGVDDVASALGKVAAVLGLLDIGRTIFAKTAELETQTASLKVLTGELGKAKTIIADLQQFAAVTPFTSSELIDSAKRLKAFGVNTEDLVTTVKRLGDVAGATGADLSGITTAYGQIQAKQRLQGEELLQLQERGVALQGELQKMYGLSGDAFRKALEGGQISAKAVEVAFQRLTAVGGKYANGAVAQSDTLNGRLSTLQDALSELARSIGKLLTPALKQALSDVTNLVNGFVNGLAYMQQGYNNFLASIRGKSADELTSQIQQIDGWIKTNQAQLSKASPQAQELLQTKLKELRVLRASLQKDLDRKQGLVAPTWKSVQLQSAAPASAVPPLLPRTSTTGAGDKRVEEAVRKGVIGGLTGGGQAGPSRGSSSGPHLHAQLVRGANLESLVDQALDFGGGRTASSFGLGRGAGPRGPNGHGYKARDYYTPQGSPFTLRPGWSATDMGIQGALGRGMRISGPGGVFELGHLQGVKTGDLNGKGAAGDLLDAQQDALNAAIEFQAKQAEQLATSKALLAVAQQDLLIAQTRDPLKRAELEGEKAQLEIKQKYAELQTNALSAEELLNLQLAERAELERAATEAMGAYIKALYEALGVAELLSSEVEKFGPKAFGGPTIPEGVNPYDPKMPNLNPGSGSGDREKLQGEYDRVKTELEKLNDPVNQITKGAEAIGTAFGTAFKDVASGAKSAQQALADAFQGIANHFLDMASQMIAKYIEMQVIGLAMNFLSSAATGAAGAGGFTFGGGGSGSSMFMPGAPTFFAEGGLVTGPTKAIIGEAGPEAVIPLEKLPSVMDRYNPGRATSLREQMAAEGGGPGGSGGSSPITLNVTATRIADDNWVKVDDLQVALAETRRQAAAEGAKAGEARTLSRLQQSPSTRRRLGM